MKRVGIAGIGLVPARATSPDVSYREMIFEAAQKAYENANMGPEDIDTFVGVSEDFNEGVSIFDEYVPDQLGAVLKPVHTISGDGLQGLISVFLQIQTGLFRTGLVEAHSKASNAGNHRKILELALDPIYMRHLEVDPHFLAGLEMREYMSEGNVKEKCLAVAVCEMKKNAMFNPYSAYPGKFKIDDVLSSTMIAEPLREGMMAQSADGAVVVILAEEDVIRGLRKEKETVWIDGIGFYTSEPSFDTWNWAKATYAELSSLQAYKMAGINCPLKEISFAELDSRYAHKIFQHIEACMLSDGRPAGKLFCSGFYSRDGQLPVNLSGSHIGIGLMDEATPLYQLSYAVDELLGRAGKNQIPNPHRALVQSWRGFPTRSGGAVILSND